ncbi:hypothetical protein JW905_09860 [bacterium]|nr:hypothetical protein [candidate division CSSED10-310 bacterium]
MTPSGDKLLRKKDHSNENRKHPFEWKDTRDGVDWYWIYDGDGGPAARLAMCFLKRDGLVSFDKALGSAVRALRNDVAHNEPTPELMDDARAQIRRERRWSDKDTFLSQPLVHAVLRELGVPVPGRLLADLLAAVRHRLVAPSVDG